MHFYHSSPPLQSLYHIDVKDDDDFSLGARGQKKKCPLGGQRPEENVPRGYASICRVLCIYCMFMKITLLIYLRRLLQHVHISLVLPKAYSLLIDYSVYSLMFRYMYNCMYIRSLIIGLPLSFTLRHIGDFYKSPYPRKGIRLLLLVPYRIPHFRICEKTG
jgi:hypothetical protein